MMALPKEYKYILSVIIPVFNNEKELYETVQSFLDCKVSGYEIIFINDGSSDNSVDVMKRIEMENPQIPITIFTQQNQGVSVARNKGIELAQGKYIFFCDGDDLLVESFIKRVMEKAQCESDIIFWKHNIQRPNGLQHLYYEEINNDVQGVTLEKDLFLAYIMKDKFRLCMGSYAVKKDLLVNNKIFFTPGCRYGEDLEFIIKMILYAKSMQYVPMELYTYVRRESSAMGRYTLKRFDAPQMVLRLLAYIENSNLAIADYNKDYLQNDYFAKQFIYSMESCLQYLTLNKYNQFWEQLRNNYPKLPSEGKRILKNVSLNKIGYTKKRMHLMKWNIYVYSFCIMFKNSLVRK